MLMVIQYIKCILYGNNSTKEGEENEYQGTLF